MSVSERIHSVIKFLNEDTWESWVVSLILIVLFIKFIFFPVLSLIFGSPLPLVIVESCSMYHDSSFDKWWDEKKEEYAQFNIQKSEFGDYSFKNGLNKGDIIIVWGKSKYKKGDIIIFKSNSDSLQRNPIIHRIVRETNGTFGTKGDNNEIQLASQNSNNPSNIDETSITPDRVLGKAVGKVPYIGWVKLVLYESSRPSYQRGFCN